MCSKFRDEVGKIIQDNHIPHELVINWEETGVHLLPTAQYTYEKEGAKQVMVDSKDDKREITCVIASTMAGELLPLQLLYQGRTECCHARIEFPTGWDVWHSDTHWATTDTCVRFAERVVKPYIDAVRERLDCAGQVSLILHDVYRAHQQPELLDKFKDMNCIVRFVPPNLTSQLQPNDQLLNRVFKCAVMNQYEDFYTAEFMRQLKVSSGDSSKISIDTRLSAIKETHARWLVSAFRSTQSRKSVIIKSWQEAGLLPRSAEQGAGDVEPISVLSSEDDNVDAIEGEDIKSTADSESD